MSATVEKETDGALQGFDELAGSFKVKYVYQGLSVGENIFEHPDIPPLDHVRVIHDVKFYARSYDWEQYFEPTSSVASNGHVIVTYDTLAGGGGSFASADFIAWEKSYQKEAKRIPTFMLQPRFYQKADGSGEGKRWDWVEQGLSVPVKYSTLNVTVNWIAGNLQTRNQIFQIISAIDAQEDHLHIITNFGSRKWVMQPAQVRQADTLRVEITYHWISDPGNGPLEVAGASDEEKNYLFVTDIERPPFHEYQVRPQLEILEDPTNQTLATGPVVYLVDLYPQKLANGQNNPRYDPSGYKTLPGNPFN